MQNCTYCNRSFKYSAARQRHEQLDCPKNPNAHRSIDELEWQQRIFLDYGVWLGPGQFYVDRRGRVYAGSEYIATLGDDNTPEKARGWTDTINHMPRNPRLQGQTAHRYGPVEQVLVDVLYQVQRNGVTFGTALDRNTYFGPGTEVYSRAQAYVVGAMFNLSGDDASNIVTILHKAIDDAHTDRA